MPEKRLARSSPSILIVVATTLAGLEAHAVNDIFELAYEEAAGRCCQVFVGDEHEIMSGPNLPFEDDFSLAGSAAGWGTPLEAISARKTPIQVPLPLSGMLLGTGFITSMLLRRGVLSDKSRTRMACSPRRAEAGDVS